MMNDVFVAFWVGGLVGLILGIAISGIFAAIANHIDRRDTYTEEDMKQAIKENFDIGYEMAKNKYARPQGEWKVSGKQGGIPITDRCTNCKYEMKWYKNKYNFCPNCGADMRGE